MSVTLQTSAQTVYTGAVRWSQQTTSHVPLVGGIVFIALVVLGLLGLGISGIVRFTRRHRATTITTTTTSSAIPVLYPQIRTGYTSTPSYSTTRINAVPARGPVSYQQLPVNRGISPSIPNPDQRGTEARTVMAASRPNLIRTTQLAPPSHTSSRIPSAESIRSSHSHSQALPKTRSPNWFGNQPTQINAVKSNNRSTLPENRRDR